MLEKLLLSAANIHLFFENTYISEKKDSFIKSLCSKIIGNMTKVYYLCTNKQFYLPNLKYKNYTSNEE